MTAAAALLLAGLALLALALGRRVPLLPFAVRSPRTSGWALIAASLAVAIAVRGVFGLIAWIGLVPVTGGVVTIAIAYRPRAPIACGVIAVLLGIVATLGV